MIEEKGIPVYRAGNAIEGNFVRGLLRGEGIPAVVHPVVGSSSGEVELRVPEIHADAAQRVVTAYERQLDSGASSEEDWVCIRCGEENEASFDLCWNCQADPGHS